MIRVRIELWSANNQLVKELARIDITNDETGGEDVGNYDVVATEGQRRFTARIEHWARKAHTVIDLVREALRSVG